ncbi:MAG: hypothetical protein IKQ39_07940 [Oscillospiraceae bacterium]|nr:hypothetical protein [Oscillospiraceae bacterium]
MLAKPSAGWCRLTLGDFTASASYLTDIPFEWLRACINGLKYHIPAAFYLDEEGSECLIVSDFEMGTYIIRRHDSTTLKRVDKLYLWDFSEQLLADIRENFEGWVCWSTSALNNEQYARRKAELTALLDEAERLLTPAQ